MRVEFSPEALADPAAFRYLTEIFWLFVDGRHRWVVPDLKLALDSRWRNEEGKSLQWAIRELAEKSARTDSLAQMRVGAGPSARQAAECLRQPLTVLVENARIDGAFLYQILRTLGESHRRWPGGVDRHKHFLEAWQEGVGDGRWVVLRHGGGGETAEQLRLLAQMSPPNFLVLVDSDRRARGAAIEERSTAGKVQAVFAEYGLSLDRLVVLEKHEVENYLPHPALQHYTPKLWRRHLARPDRDDDFDDLKANVQSDLWRVLMDPAYERHLSAKHWRERAGNRGRELDGIIDRLIDLW
jgi:hypothetical protein